MIKSWILFHVILASNSYVDMCILFFFCYVICNLCCRNVFAKPVFLFLFFFLNLLTVLSTLGRVGKHLVFNCLPYVILFDHVLRFIPTL